MFHTHPRNNFLASSILIHVLSWCHLAQVGAIHPQASLGPQDLSWLKPFLGLPVILGHQMGGCHYDEHMCGRETGEKEKGTVNVLWKEAGQKKWRQWEVGCYEWPTYTLDHGDILPSWCRGPCLGVWSQSSKGLWWHLWTMLPPKATRIPPVAT